ncbi:GNAT family N-acetyltransferase [Sphingomonas abietis]|uniref:GNAT family N-acetyltransferase n=1 Tax=Sphingomonas abietis TaxID=3012344 RepID=A0ABY7NPV1_9SPHN|nr:GNAT family N-acetyltransferase [Sphingomonas abietis]WBO23560.1 GNAT family N-acetyltransferase [Sphingomonas abietis]
MSVTIRPVRVGDAEAIAAIYAPYVTDTAITFELDPPDAAEMRARIERITLTHPWLVAERDGVVAGYAYGAPYRTRSAYRWVAETGIYVSREARGGGIGTPLYRALLDELERRGFVAAMGVMTAGNPASSALHERLGFIDTGTQPGIGYKHGGWHDVVFWQKDLAARTTEPAGTT